MWLSCRTYFLWCLPSRQRNMTLPTAQSDQNPPDAVTLPLLWLYQKGWRLYTFPAFELHWEEIHCAHKQKCKTCCRSSRRNAKHLLISISESKASNGEAQVQEREILNDWDSEWLWVWKCGIDERARQWWVSKTVMSEQDSNERARHLPTSSSLSA